MSNLPQSRKDTMKLWLGWGSIILPIAAALMGFTWHLYSTNEGRITHLERDDAVKMEVLRSIDARLGRIERKLDR